MLHMAPGKPSTTTKAPTDTDLDVMASSLLLFCDFLAQRLHTENLVLLKRAISEFEREPRECETVRCMIRFAFPMVVIKPIVLANTDAREAASQLLGAMRANATQQDHAIQFLRDFYDALRTKIVLVNWDSLLTMFREFCVGQEHSLIEFVALQKQAISIIPIRPVPSPTTARRVQPTIPGHNDPPELVCPSVKSEPLQTTTPVFDFEERTNPTPNKPERRQTTSSVFDFDEDETSSPSASSAITASQRRTEDRETLYDEFCVVEAHEPWKALYGVAEAELPVVARCHPWLARNLARFWHKHGRAVWERNFWHRFARSSRMGTAVQSERNRRQDRALHNFELTVLMPCYKHFGAAFFVDLDAREERVSWWWYRQPIVDIVRLCDRDGLAASVAYLRSQCRERFPQRPVGCDLHTEAHHADGRSMWSTRDKYQFITDEIDELKREQRGT